jgi:hypothetical protein
VVRKGFPTDDLRRFRLHRDRCFGYNSIVQGRLLRYWTMVGYSRTLAWGLAVLVAIQPVAAFPCTCGIACGKPAKAPASRSCCQKASGLSNPVGSPSAVGVRISREKGRCCCSGANVCACKLRTPPSAKVTPPQRAQSDDLATFSPALDGALPSGVHSGHSMRSVDALPAWVSGSDRCIALCRLLF